MDVSLQKLEPELTTPATVDSDWWDYPLLPASLMEAGPDQHQFAIVN